ncbi:MAG TPA: hypothetical protein ENI31_03295 [Candidatus Omnitrophica bacterium]|nr:MAG: hypothetical protein DRP69_04690 [Candidatus Omnitrophota bacterium]RKY44070.1 MAG: hypothetical protein DRP80_03430 [Candidatus Omnitrophota bacterium]HEC69295.1 hypothetical protein [Candidatus Omnitrophota bacterium]
MIRNIIIKNREEIKLEVEFFDNPTSKKILENLPLTSSVNLWGEEIYFDTGITASFESATLDVKAGDLACWPEGKCLCVFFGRTPLNREDKPVPAGEGSNCRQSFKGVRRFKKK